MVVTSLPTERPGYTEKQITDRLPVAKEIFNILAAGFLTAFDKHWNFALTSGEIRLGRGRIGQSPKTEKKRLD